MTRWWHSWARRAALTATLLLASCSNWTEDWTKAPHTADDNHLVSETDPSPEIKKAAALHDTAVGLHDPSQPVMSIPPHTNGGALHEVSLPNRQGTSPAAGAGGDVGAEGARQRVQLQFADASLRSVIDFLFQQYLKKPYTVLGDFKDHKVNWIASGNFTTAEILRMFEAFLEVQGVTLSEREGVFIVASAPQRADLSEPPIGQTTGIWRLTYIDAKELLTLARMFVATADRVQVMDSGNMLIATAGGTEIRNLDAFIGRIDVPPFENTHVMVYTPRFVSAQALVALLQGLPKRLGSTLPDSKKTIDADVIQGSPQVVIVLRDAGMIKVVEQFLREIDDPSQDRRQVFYYTVRTQKADDVRNTLDQLLKPLFKDDQGTAPSVLVHQPTNSLLITATPEQFYQIKSVIDRIDYALPSVLLDAVIAEVSLNDELAYGVEWFLRGEAARSVGTLSTATDPFAAGLTQVATPTATVGALSLASDIVGTLNLLSQKTKLQVLSRPRVIVANKDKATIKSVLEEQIIASNANSNVQVSGTAQILTQYQTKEVGITLEVTPTIADDGTIKMLLHIEDSDQGPLTNGQPSFDKRQIDTTLVVGNGETIFIGGIIKRQSNLNNQKVPGLGDLPVIGNAFKSSDTATQNSELVILVTPHVFSDRAGARLVTDAFSGFARPALDQPATKP